jgi:hypothetical protein
MKIYKWTLKLLDRQIIPMPEGSEILTVQAQNGVPCLWAVVNETAQPVPRVIAIYGTGNPMPEMYGKYIASFQQVGFVWHVFELFE